MAEVREQALKIKSKIVSVTKNDQESLCFTIMFSVLYDNGQERDITTFTLWRHVGEYPTLEELRTEMQTLRDAYRRNLEAQNAYDDIIGQEYEDDISGTA